MSFVSVHAPSNEGPDGPAMPSGKVPDRLGTNGGRAVEVAGPMPFAVAVQRRDDVASVRPAGELDVATVETLRAALDSVESAECLLLDLRGLSFIDSTGLHLLVALVKRARDDGIQLTLLAPPAPVDRAIRLCGLDEALPFGTALLADRGRGR
jgi:anti-sigma B factor antagonist